MHRVNITHRDIKPENILIAEEDNIYKYIYKIVDLGSGKDREKELGEAETGTRGYKASEIIFHFPHDQDVWSFGVLLYRLLFYAYPFQKENYQEEVLRGKCIISSLMEVSAQVVDLLRSLSSLCPMRG